MGRPLFLYKTKMKFLDLQNLIKDTYENNPLVKMTLDNSSLINSKGTKYWCVAYDIQSVTEYDDYTAYQYNIYAMERMDDRQDNINQHYSTGMEILRHGFEDLEQDGLWIDRPISYQMNSLKFADVLDVVMATVTINVENDDCD